jgi:F0F1-type ATP synthase assembly protein I
MALPNPEKRSGKFARQFAWAIELPFLLVGTVLAGGLFGYFLDRWLKTKPFMMLAFGALGFFVGVRDLLRRLQKEDSNDQPDS